MIQILLGHKPQEYEGTLFPTLPLVLRETAKVRLR